jgi:hypothetical protein
MPGTLAANWPHPDGPPGAPSILMSPAMSRMSTTKDATSSAAVLTTIWAPIAPHTRCGAGRSRAEARMGHAEPSGSLADDRSRVRERALFARFLRGAGRRGRRSILRTGFAITFRTSCLTGLMARPEAQRCWSEAVMAACARCRRCCHRPTWARRIRWGRGPSCRRRSRAEPRSRGLQGQMRTIECRGFA